jgi:tetratricopeptide (TPR) repeat protein
VLTAKKKIAVREIAPKSSMLQYWETVRTFFEAYRRQIYWVLGALIVVLVGGYIYINNKRANEEEASRALRKIQPLIQQNQYKLAISGDPTRQIPGLKEIADRYSGTATGETATILLGNAYLYTDQFDKALEAFDNASPSSSIMKSSAVAGMAAAYEGKKNWAEAAKHYEEAAKMYENDFLSASRFFFAGRNYCMSGNKEKAGEMFKLVGESETPRYEADMQRLKAQYGIEE